MKKDFFKKDKSKGQMTRDIRHSSAGKKAEVKPESFLLDLLAEKIIPC